LEVQAIFSYNNRKIKCTGQENMPNPSEPVRKTPSRAAKKKNRPNIQSVHPPKPVKKTPSRAAKKAAQAAVTSRPVKTNTKRRNIIAITSIALVVVLIAALAYYLIAVMPMQSIILTVNNDNISTGYFLKRVVANPNGVDVSSTIQGLIGEYIIKQQAATMGVAPVTDQAIDDYLRDEANSSLSSGTTTSSTTTPTTTTPTDNATTTGSTTTPTTTPTMSDAEFNEWFKEQLANTGLSVKEYREVAGCEIQRQRLTDILSANIPSTMAQIHLWAIDFNSNSAALAAKAKIDSGTAFATVANTIAGQTNGGELGWMPLAVLPADLETAASTLDVGKCSDPIEYTQSDSTSSSGTTTSYVLLMISEKSDSMPVTADQLSILKNNSLNNWLDEQLQSTKVTLHERNGTTINGTTTTLDNATLTWLDYQAQK
jgi:cell division septation protein DedD